MISDNFKKYVLIQFQILQGFVKRICFPQTNLFRRDLSIFNERQFEEVIHSMNWINICKLENNNPNLSCNNFFNSIIYQLDEFAPFKKVIKN